MKTRLAAKLHIGRIHYLNTLPFYHGLIAAKEVEAGQGWQWQSGTPAQINQKMAEGQIDLAPVSSLEYLRHQDRYLLFPDVCIGATDFSSSVLLFSRDRLEGLAKAKIALTEESASAAALIKILLKFKHHFENTYTVEPSNPEKMLEHADACLIIGDQALFYEPKEFLYKSDLSELWWDWTALPFCFSVWAVRRAFYEDHPEDVRFFYQRLKAAVDRNLEDLEKLLRDGCQIMLGDEKFTKVFGYLFNLNYLLDDSMKQGLLKFAELAHALHLIPKTQKLEFIEP